MVFSGAKKSRHHKDVWIFVLSEGCDITYRCHACAWNCRAIEPNGFGPTYESPKKETIRMDGFFFCFHYTIDELPTCRSSLDQLQNQARFCKMFSLPHGSRRRICPKRLLQNRSDTVGRSYSYDILKNCTLERGEQCTICSVVYCKLMEYVV